MIYHDNRTRTYPMANVFQTMSTTITRTYNPNTDKRLCDVSYDLQTCLVSATKKKIVRFSTYTLNHWARTLDNIFFFFAEKQIQEPLTIESVVRSKYVFVSTVGHERCVCDVYKHFSLLSSSFVSPSLWYEHFVFFFFYVRILLFGSWLSNADYAHMFDVCSCVFCGILRGSPHKISISMQCFLHSSYEEFAWWKMSNFGFFCLVSWNSFNDEWQNSRQLCVCRVTGVGEWFEGKEKNMKRLRCGQWERVNGANHAAMWNSISAFHVQLILSIWLSESAWVYAVRRFLLAHCTYYVVSCRAITNKCIYMNVGLHIYCEQAWN